jgi:ketosteroid isomerase-like protein
MKFIIPILMIILFGACKQQSGNTDADPLEEAKAAIASSNAIYFEAYATNDPGIFVSRYAPDACLLVPGAERACGTENMARFFRFSYDRYGMRNGKFTTTAVYGDGIEYVTEEGTWQSFDDTGRLFDDGKFLVLWKKTVNGWKMFRDSFSSNHSHKK